MDNTHANLIRKEDVIEIIQKNHGISSPSIPEIQKLPSVSCLPMREIGNWIMASQDECQDGYDHHKCSCCNNFAPFYYEMDEDFDENLDGEWVSLGMRENGIVENLTRFCPECGVEMAVFDNGDEK